MQCYDLDLKGLKVILPQVYRDERGFFFESYQSALYLENEMGPFVQDNTSFSKKGTIRALHFQSDPGQDKLVSCIQGQIWDVAVDIRPESPTFMQWKSLVLDDQEHQQFFIPKGFAHGYCVLSEKATVQYKVSSPYNPTTERSIRWNDPELNINWPVQTPILSIRDQTSPFFKEIQDALDCRP